MSITGGQPVYVSLLFWFALALPGYVLVRRFAEDELRSGLLGTLSLSYLAVLALLSPVSILCYLTDAPLVVFSSVCVLIVLASLFELTRRRWWRGLGKLLAAAASVELLIIVADMVLGARVGGYLEGDARVHLARIRFLVDHGFGNGDPFVAAKHFFPIYHTNILHALYAACTQTTRVDHLGVWFASLAWGKLLIASGMYYLVWSIFGRRWPAWLAAICAAGMHGPVTFIIYPNKLAPLWVIPCMIGFAIRALERPCAWPCCVRLGIGSLLLGQIHGLYAIFAALLLAPVLGAVAVVKVVRNRPDRWPLAACVLALAVGLPFPLVSKLTANPRSPGVASPTPDADDDGAFLRLDNGWIMKDPRQGFTAGGTRVVLLCLGMAAALATRRRRQAACFIACLAVAAVVLYTPPICTVMVRALGAQWILGRFGFVLPMGVVALLVPAAAWWLEPKPRPWWVRGPVSVVVLIATIAWARLPEPHTWTTFWNTALNTKQDRQAKLEQFRGIRDFLTDHLPAGETVLINQEPGTGLVMLYNCHIVAAATSNNGVTDLAQRRVDLKTMMAEDTPRPTRRDLLNKYGIRYYVPYPAASRWAQARVDDYWRQPEGMVLVLLKTE